MLTRETNKLAINQFNSWGAVGGLGKELFVEELQVCKVRVLL